MAKRDNHYEAAFEAWLIQLGVPYIAVDESHRSRLPGGSLKNIDFLVAPSEVQSWLVDVKGRQFPTSRHTYWRNWSTGDELKSLSAWEELFGPKFAALLVFAYNVVGDIGPLPADDLFVFRGALYGFVGIRLDHYTSFARPLSRRWGTVSMPTEQFRALARPAREFFGIPDSGPARQGSTTGASYPCA